MKALLRIQLKPGVLDAEAAEIERALAAAGHGEGLAGVRKAKLIELDFATEDAAEAERRARAMAEGLLANPVIETYEVTIAS